MRICPLLLSPQKENLSFASCISSRPASHWNLAHGQIRAQARAPAALAGAVSHARPAAPRSRGGLCCCIRLGAAAGRHNISSARGNAAGRRYRQPTAGLGPRWRRRAGTSRCCPAANSHIKAEHLLLIKIWGFPPAATRSSWKPNFWCAHTEVSLNSWEFWLWQVLQLPFLKAWSLHRNDAMAPTGSLSTVCKCYLFLL